MSVFVREAGGALQHDGVNGWRENLRTRHCEEREARRSNLRHLLMRK